MKFSSRKFLVTLTITGLTFFLARDSQMTADVALVFAAAIGSYNVAQGWVDSK